MHRSSFILGSIGVFFPHYLVGKNKSPSEWWNDADSTQRDFARQCVEYGNTLGDLTSWTDNPGATLAGITWMEVSFVEGLEHDEDSSGPFGLSDNVREYYDGRTRNGIVLNGHSGTFEDDAKIALALYDDNYRYFRRLGYSKKEAWFWGYPRYNAGGKWRNFKQRGIVFSNRIRFLKEQFK